VISDDGRHFIRTSKEKFDIITSDPIDPWVKGCAALNTVDYYQMCKDHLNPGGVMSLCIPLYESNVETAKSVIATFFNFAPAEVLRCIPAAWDLAAPEAVLEARLAGIDETLRRILGDQLDGADVAEAADLARTATEALTPEGRPLYAGHASLPWPEPPHLVLSEDEAHDPDELRARARG